MSTNTPHSIGNFRQRVIEATAQLPIAQVEALWLIDVCGSDYATAATQTRSTTLEFTKRLHTARRSIRNTIHQ